MISGSFTDLTWVDFTPGLVLNKSSWGTHLSCSLYHIVFSTATRENSASIYSLRGTSNLLSICSGGDIIPNTAWEPGYAWHSQQPKPNRRARFWLLTVRSLYVHSHLLSKSYPNYISKCSCQVRRGGQLNSQLLQVEQTTFVKNIQIGKETN